MARPSDRERKPGFNLVKIYDGFEVRQNSASDQWCGRSSILSGDTTVTISSTNVKSDGLPFAMLHLPISSHADLTISVRSLVDSGFVTFGVNLGVSDDQEINWFVYDNLTS